LGITLLLNSNKGGIFCVISTTRKNNRPGLLIMTALATLMFIYLFNWISRVKGTSICHLPISSRMKQFLACIDHKVLKLKYHIFMCPVYFVLTQSVDTSVVQRSCPIRFSDNMTINLLASYVIIFVTYEVLGVPLLRIQVTRGVTLCCWMSGYWWFF
jgi:hypothetical protein